MNESMKRKYHGRMIESILTPKGWIHRLGDKEYSQLSDAIRAAKNGGQPAANQKKDSK